MSTEQHQIGVDVGGTNTDIVLTTDDEEYRFKTPTTDDPSKSTVDGIRTVCERADVPFEDIERIFHGTTIATNAVIEADWAKTGMVTTEGFRDVLHIGRHRKPENFSIQHPIPWQEEPVVDRRHRKTVSERLYPTTDGTRVRVDTPLDTSEVLTAAEALVADGVQSIAVCFLHSYLDPSHERAAKEAIESAFPDVFVCTSAEVVAQFREYERFTTAAINASLQPQVSGYLDRIADRLTAAGFDADVLIMQSNGGVAGLEEIARYPVRIINSGPAAGVLSASYIADRSIASDLPELITLDIGGTSADISVLPGEILERDPRDSTIAGGYPVLSPMIDVEAIGSGGGSIAWFDHAKGFNIGPKSAGADPGPACYGRGNTQPTVTDAQVVLGRLNPETFLDGAFDLAVENAEDAIYDNLCTVVDDERFETTQAAALSTLEVANTKMQQAIRRQTVRRGYDPRTHTLVAFGGAGPLHACDIAEKLDISEILVPPSPGLASARGVLTSDVREVDIVTIKQRLQAADVGKIAELYGRLRDTCQARLAANGVSPEDETYRSTVDCLYEGQGYELTVEFDGTDGNWRSRIRERFERAHAEEYGHASQADPIVLLNLRVTATGAVETPELVPLERTGTDVEQAKTLESPVVFGTPADPEERLVARYDRTNLPSGGTLEGPAIVDAPDSTLVLKPAWEAAVLENGTLRLRKDTK